MASQVKKHTFYDALGIHIYVCPSQGCQCQCLSFLQFLHGLMQNRTWFDNAFLLLTYRICLSSNISIFFIFFINLFLYTKKERYNAIPFNLLKKIGYIFKISYCFFMSTKCNVRSFSTKTSDECYHEPLITCRKMPCKMRYIDKGLHVPIPEEAYFCRYKS